MRGSIFQPFSMCSVRPGQCFEHLPESSGLSQLLPPAPNLQNRRRLFVRAQQSCQQAASLSLRELWTARASLGQLRLSAAYGPSDGLRALSAASGLGSPRASARSCRCASRRHAATRIACRVDDARDVTALHTPTHRDARAHALARDARTLPLAHKQEARDPGAPWFLTARGDGPAAAIGWAHQVRVMPASGWLFIAREGRVGPFK
jgi:hypothetical protein